MRFIALALLVVLAACSPPANVQDSDANASGADAAPVAENNLTDSGQPDYSGRWIGVEGMNLVASHSGAPGHYRLVMQWDLDHKGSFEGVAEAAGIAFTREGVRETLAPGDGDATGLKYLAGKKDCLIVKPGEGYCRAE